MKQKPPLKVIYSPTFLEQLNNNFGPEEREEIWQDIMEAMKELEDNPYAGTPVYRGFLSWRVFVNWLKRSLWKMRCHFGLIRTEIVPAGLENDVIPLETKKD